MKRIRYLNIDIRRAFGTWKIAVGSLGVCLTLLYNSSGAVSVLGWLGNIAGNAVLIMAALIFSVYPYSAAFCDDMEYSYDRQMVLRGGAASYSLSKMTAVFLSAAVTMFTGFLLAALFLLVRYGLPDSESIQQIQDNCGSLYKLLLLNGHFLLFAFCIGVHLAVLAGTLAVIGLMCSLFVKNRMLVYILPVAFLYIEDILVQRMMGWEFGSLFSLNCMGVTTLGSSLEIHTWQLYYLEVFLLLLFIGAVICFIYRRKVV